MSDEREPSVQLFSYKDDTPTEIRGALIPRSIAIDEIAVETDHRGTFFITVRRLAKLTLVPVTAVALLALAAVGSYSIVDGEENVASVPSITILDPYSSSRTVLTQGPQEALSQPTFFTEVRDAMIEQNQTFLEIDSAQSSVRYFENGVLLQQVPTVAVGEPGSWWDVPSGLYTVTNKQETYFSSYTQTNFPWTIIFEGNYMVHGVPTYPNGDNVSDEFLGGGVRLETGAAEKLYSNVETGIPVIVRAIPTAKNDTFVYEPAGPAITATEYAVVDIENQTVLTAEQVDAVVPIASLTKLMTAIVAAEKMNLDQRVYAASPTFVESLIPRLVQRSSVSMYSLLQLLLVESSNEAAEVIAGEYGRDEFIAAMNDKARTLGMFDSNFADPSGISADNTSSIADLLKLTEYIYEKRDFIFEITATGEAVGVNGGGEFVDLNNFNQIQEITSFVGGKIGETEAAGKTSISLHRVTINGQERVLAVILLGATERNQDVKDLLDFVTENYE